MQALGVPAKGVRAGEEAGRLPAHVPRSAALGCGRRGGAARDGAASNGDGCGMSHYCVPGARRGAEG